MSMRVQTCWNLLLVVCFLSLMVGCGNSKRLPVKGEVSIDGTPVQEGFMNFTPLPGTEGPTAGAKIADGKYEIDPLKSLFEGNYVVSIKVWKQSKRVTEDFATGERERGIIQILPPKYNSESELTLELVRGEDTYNFELEL